MELRVILDFFVFGITSWCALAIEMLLQIEHVGGVQIIFDFFELVLGTLLTHHKVNETFVPRTLCNQTLQRYLNAINQVAKNDITSSVSIK